MQAQLRCGIDYLSLSVLPLIRFKFIPFIHCAIKSFKTIKLFFGTNSLSPIDDIESEQLIRTICEMIKPEAALYNPYDAYSFKYALKAAFGTFKKENLSSDQLIKNCDALIKDLENDESLRYTTNRKGKWEKGDLKVNDYNKAKKKLEKN